MAEKYLISAPTETRARIAGELEKATRRVDDLRISLLHVDACLRMLDEGYEPLSIRPKRTFGKHPAGLKKREGARTALEVLRETGERLDSNELARRVLEKLGKEISPNVGRAGG